MSFCLWNHFGCVCGWKQPHSSSGQLFPVWESQDESRDPKIRLGHRIHCVFICLFFLFGLSSYFLWWNTAQKIYYCHMQSCIIQCSETYSMDLIRPRSKEGRTQQLTLCSCFTLNNRRRGYSPWFISSQLQFVMRQNIFWYWKHLSQLRLGWSQQIHSQKADCGEFSLLINNIFKWMTWKGCQSHSQTVIYWLPDWVDLPKPVNMAESSACTLFLPEENVQTVVCKYYRF